MSDIEFQFLFDRGTYRARRQTLVSRSKTCALYNCGCYFQFYYIRIILAAVCRSQQVYLKIHILSISQE